MSKPLQSSPSTKSIKSRMGTIMKRSSTALTGGFSRPGTPARSSTESLRFDASAPGPEIVVPSPVAESPAREAAESAAEPTGPSKLSSPPIAPDPAPAPLLAPAPILAPAPVPAAAPAASSDAVPVSLLESLPRKSSPEPIPAKSAVVPPYVSGSPESLSRAASEHPDEAPPVRQSEDSGSTQSHGQVIPHDRQLPTEVHAEQEALAVPKSLSSRTNSRTNLATVDRVATPPLATEAPFVRVDNASAEVASLMLKSRTRGSTVSSQVRPHTPPAFNGRVSRKASVSSLASSAAALSSYPLPVVSAEPRQEGAGAVPATRQALGDPYKNEWAAAPVDDVPLPPPSEVIHAMPIQTAPSNLSAAPPGSIFSPREPVEYDTDESRPLLQPSTTSLKNPPYYGQTEPARSVSVLASQNEGALWPAPVRKFASLGWQEFLLPDGARYFSSPTLHVVTDVDLRNTERLDVITTFLDGRDPEVLPPPEWELWLRDASEPATASFLVKAWVHHAARMVLFERPSLDPGEIVNKDVDKTDMAYQYWSFMMSHPAHAPLPSESVSEAIDVLTWSYTDRLLPSSLPSIPPFSQEECQELLTLLRSFNHLSAQTVSVVRTRVVSKVLVRVAAWRQGRPRDGATFQDSWRNYNGPSTRVPFRRSAGDFIISFVCLGLPYLFLERSHHQRFDTESGVRSNAGPMLVVGALACLIAAVIMSASVTFITLPGIDDISRVAGLLAILLSASSLVSAVIALFRYKSDIENPIAYPRGEGLVLLSRRSVLLSLPLVFLLYAIVAFITGISLYAFRGLSTTAGGRHFEDFTQWAVIGTIGGLACILLTSQTLIH